MRTRIPLPAGRWLRARPRVAGLYFSRQTPSERPTVTWFDPRVDEDSIARQSTIPLSIPWALADPEWFYCSGDAPG